MPSLMTWVIGAGVVIALSAFLRVVAAAVCRLSRN